MRGERTAAVLLVLIACGERGEQEGGAATTGPGSSGTDTGTSATASSTETGDHGPKLDVGPETDTDTATTGDPPSCKVEDDMDAPGACDETAPPDSFEPAVQWIWEGENGDYQAIVTPTGQSLSGDPPGWWDRPATVHDFDGDGLAEAAASSGSHYTVFERDATKVWSADVLDASGIAAGSAFDFLGDAVAEAMYADESTLYIFGGMGEVLLQVPRTSWTTTEYPIVVDVDNDGSAEIIVVSAEKDGMASPTVQVIRDVEDRWIQARRIWNQHTYHVTNVREDGTIPQFEKPSWKALNTFRTQA